MKLFGLIIGLGLAFSPVLHAGDGNFSEDDLKLSQDSGKSGLNYFCNGHHRSKEIRVIAFDDLGSSSLFVFKKKRLIASENKVDVSYQSNHGREHLVFLGGNILEGGVRLKITIDDDRNDDLINQGHVTFTDGDRKRNTRVTCKLFAVPR